MAELLTEAGFLEKKQSAKIHGEKLKIEKEYARSKTKVKIVGSNLKIIKGNSTQIVSTKERWTKPLMKSQEFSIKESESITVIKQVLVEESLTSVLLSSHSLKRQ